MARMRYVKPEYWTDSKVVRCSIPARLLFIGMWNHACDYGHLEDDSLSLRLKILPMDDVDIDALLDELNNQGLVLREATDDGRLFLHIPHLPDHQKVETRWSQRCSYCRTEPPQTSREVGREAGSHTEPLPTTTEEGIGEEGIGGDRRGSAEGDRRKRATTIPGSFAIDDKMRQWAKDNVPDIDIDFETEKFKDFHGAKGNRYVDWRKAWFTWMRNAVSYNGKRKTTSGPQWKDWN